MDVKQASDRWAEQYDTNNNKTRDLEALALRKTLSDIPFRECLEIGCGTGKKAAKDNDFELLDMEEYFDDDDKSGIPRILTLLFRKK